MRKIHSAPAMRQTEPAMRLGPGYGGTATPSGGFDSPQKRKCEPLNQNLPSNIKVIVKYL
eukprot:UN14085